MADDKTRELPIKPRTKPCPQCGGCGFVPHGCGQMTMTCPTCKGTGRIRIKKARKP